MQCRRDVFWRRALGVPEKSYTNTFIFRNQIHHIASLKVPWPLKSMVGRNKSFWIGLFSITFRGALFVSGNVSSIGIIFAPSSFAFQFYFARGTKSLAFEGLVLWRSEYWYKDDSWIFIEMQFTVELMYRCCFWQWWHWFCFNDHHDNAAAAAVAGFLGRLGRTFQRWFGRFKNVHHLVEPRFSFFCDALTDRNTAVQLWVRIPLVKRVPPPGNIC